MPVPQRINQAFVNPAEAGIHDTLAPELCLDPDWHRGDGRCSIQVRQAVPEPERSNAAIWG